MVVLYHFCNFISILIFIFVNFIQKCISFLCSFTCFSLLYALLTPFLTSFPCFFISEALKYHFRIFSGWKFYGNLLQFPVSLPACFPRCAPIRATTYYRPACFSRPAWVYFKNPLQKFLSACPKCNFSIDRGRISDLPAKNSCHLPNMWVSAKISQWQFQRTAPGFDFPPLKIYSTLLHFLFSGWHHMLCHNP